MLLPVWKLERWLYIDSKSVFEHPEKDELSIRGVGIRVDKIPKRWKPGEHYRLVLPPASRTSRAETQDRVIAALEQAQAVGNVCVVFDEAAYLFGTFNPSLGLAGYGQDFYQRSRGMDITVIAATQAARNVATSMYDQSNLFIASKFEDRKQRTRVLEIFGEPPGMREAMAKLERFEFIFKLKYPPEMFRSHYVL